MTSEEVRDPAATVKARQRGQSVLERRAEEQRVEQEKEEARRPRAEAKRSPSATPVGRDKNGGEDARGRGRQRINEAGNREQGGADALQQRSRSLVAKKNYRRSVVVSSVKALNKGCGVRAALRWAPVRCGWRAPASFHVRSCLRLTVSVSGVR